MKALIIGGDRSGEFVDVLDGAQVWVDIRSASHHRIRSFTNMVTVPQSDGTQRVTEAYVLHLAVHEALLGPDEYVMVREIVTALAMNAFTREHGVAQEIPQEPSAAERLTLPGKS